MIMKSASMLIILCLLSTSCNQVQLAVDSNVDSRVKQVIDEKLQSVAGHIVTGNLKTQGVASKNVSEVIESIITRKDIYDKFKPSGLNQQFVDTSNCVQYSGDPRDYDGDGIGRDYTATFSCTYTSVSGKTSLSGSYRIHDLDDNNLRSGFSRVVNNMQFKILSNNDTYLINENFAISPNGDYSEYIGSIDSNEADSGSTSNAYTSLLFNPGNVNTPYSQGILYINGTGLLTEKNGNPSNISFHSDDIKLTNQCGKSSYIENGIINFNISNRAAQTMVYSQCDAVF